VEGTCDGSVAWCSPCWVHHRSNQAIVASQEINGKENDKTVPNPTYEEWFALDQQVIGFLFSSVSKEVLPQVATKEIVAAAWKEIKHMFCHR
jgi:hypothetical protein